MEHCEYSLGQETQGTPSANDCYRRVHRYVLCRSHMKTTSNNRSGTGLFIGSGSALATGGPASLLISFIAIGAVLFCTVQALGEMAVTFPVAGSFSAWAAITIFLLIITSINLCSVRVYGEAEYVFSIMKVTAVIGFMCDLPLLALERILTSPSILGAVINCGGTQDSGYIGGQYWANPGAFHNGFKGFCNILVTAAFSFSGTELVGLAAAETHNPSKSLPTAIKQVFWRIAIVSTHSSFKHPF